MSEFVKATIIRAIRTICQTAVATIGSAMALSEVDWKLALSAAALSGILSVLTSIATGLPEVQSAEEFTTEELEEFEDDLSSIDEEDEE